MTKLQSVRRTVMISEPMKIFTARQVAELSAMVAPDRFSTRKSNRGLHLHDISFHQGVLPAGVIWPESTKEVSVILVGAYERKLSLKIGT